MQDFYFHDYHMIYKINLSKMKKLSSGWTTLNSQRLHRVSAHDALALFLIFLHLLQFFDGGERRVGFSLTEAPAERQNRLHRRDTPHHLKNKRVNLNMNTAKMDQEKVASIIAQVRYPSLFIYASIDSFCPSELICR